MTLRVDDPLFERQVDARGLPAARRMLLYAARTTAGAVMLGGTWALVRLVQAAGPWAGFAIAGAVAMAWCGWLEARGPQG